MNFRIRRVFDDFLPVNRRAIDQIISITKARIPDMDESYYESMRSMFRNPVYQKMRYIFFVCDDSRGDVKGFAQFSVAQDLNFCYLDIIATSSSKGSGGLGSALYERVREEAIHLGAKGIFIECQADDEKQIQDQKALRENRARLKFYERYGARPILHTRYEMHAQKRYGTPYFLLYDPLTEDGELSSSRAKKIIRAVLERKYEPPAEKKEIDTIVASITGESVILRDFRYGTHREVQVSLPSIPEDWKIPLFYNKNHDIHHIRERGYVESPVRIRSILDVIIKSDLFIEEKTTRFPDRFLLEVHDKSFVSFFKKVSADIKSGRSLYPDVFPVRSETNKPRRLVTLAGYYSMDVYSPINRNAYLAARKAVDCALSGAKKILDGSPVVYALVRPPGHHAQRSLIGGFCYFNSTAIAAKYLGKMGRVAILDLDYHHGNGQQDIFYETNEVYTISIHGDPHFEYPHFSGFKTEKGMGDGEGFNLNLPLPEKTDGKTYRKSLTRALGAIRKFSPDFLVIALGLDTAKGDPTGTWMLEPEDFRANGEMIGKLGLPLLVVQEGGYNTRTLGVNALQFFSGLIGSSFKKRI